MRKKPLTAEEKEVIVKYLKDGRKPRDIADELGIKRQAMGSYCRDFKHLYYHKCNSTYFNVDLYIKTVATL
jgi:hypothetical protein